MIRGIDIFILLALERDTFKGQTYASLSESLGVSQSEVYRSIQRSAQSHLIHKDTRRVRRAELLEFITHGIRYAFAVTPGRAVRGLPTCWGAPGLESHMTTDELDVFVWPHPQGTQRGRAVEPLHSAVTFVASQDEALYRQFALCDAIRLGGARERRLASDLLKKELQQ